jgi:hypothetical protein
MNSQQLGHQQNGASEAQNTHQAILSHQLSRKQRRMKAYHLLESPLPVLHRMFKFFSRKTPKDIIGDVILPVIFSALLLACLIQISCALYEHTAKLNTLWSQKEPKQHATISGFAI